MAKGKYQEWLTEDGLLQIESWARDGLTDEQIANNMGIAARTLYKWQNKYKQISQSIKKGKAPVDIEVENALLKRALGEWVVEEEKTVDQVGDGEPRKRITTRKRYIPPDTTAGIFWLKQRKGKQWNSMSESQEYKLAVEAKKLEIEMQKLEQELIQMQEDKATEIVIIDKWSNEDAKNN